MVAMILKLDRRELLRLREARGVAIEVLDGCVWITEDGSAQDNFLRPGRRYEVGGNGLVLVSPENVAESAEIALTSA
jgi:Protein of unknown function (DUF2917)